MHSLRTITVKGFLVQLSWETELQLSCIQAGDDSEHYIYHRAVEIEVPIFSLRFDPQDTKKRDEIISLQKIKCLEKHKADKCLEIEKINQQIQELLSIGHEESPVFDDNAPF